MTLSRIHAASLSIVVILLLCMVSVVVAIPVVEPPVVSSPVVDVSPVPDSTLHQPVTPDESDSGNWEMVSGSSDLLALPAGGGGSFVETAAPGSPPASGPLTAPAKGGLMDASGLSGSWVYVTTKRVSRNWYGAQYMDVIGKFTNPGGKATNRWKVTLYAPKNNLDLYVFRWNGNKWVYLGASRNPVSRESGTLTVYNNNHYLFRVQRAGGSTGKWTAALKFYYYKDTPTPPNPPNDPVSTQIINAHQTYRSQVGSPRLVWNANLAASALAWAKHIAALGQPKHSNKPGVGENIWMGWPPGRLTYAQMVNSWGAEKKNYIHRPFGDEASRTGRWQDIGHYTQVVWKKTTQVGCGKASANGKEFFVCQYSPPGNIWGQYAY